MATWEQLENYCLNCHRCKLHSGRTNVVIGDGNKNADIMFIGEGPGQQEDLQGLPFVGPAGQLFNKMLNSIGLDRQKVYICNVVKCRPPYNRDPEDDEKNACLPLLRAQVSLVKPKIIVCLGRIAGNVVMHQNFRITKEHGIWEERKGYWLSATYHPSALLRDQSKKRDAWEDLKKLRAKIEELGIFAEQTAKEQPNQTLPDNAAPEPKATEEAKESTYQETNIALQNKFEPQEPENYTANSEKQQASSTAAEITDHSSFNIDLPWQENAEEKKTAESTEFESTADNNSPTACTWQDTAEISETEEENPFDDIDFSPDADISFSSYESSPINSNGDDDDLDLLVF